MKLKELLEKSHKGMAIVFDLDSTLFDVSHRTERIIYDFINQNEVLKQFPKECENVKNFNVQFHDWGLKDTFEKYGENFSKSFIKKANSFWSEHFFKGESFHYDLPYKGAVNFVKKLEKKGSQIFYLTARSENSRTHTQKVLKKWDFPSQSQNLFLRPHNFENCDSVYKACVIKSLTKKYEEVWFFDNDPKNLLRIEEEIPQVQIIFLDTVHCGTYSPKKSWFSVTAPHFFKSHLSES